MRLRALGLIVGTAATGPRNSIVDVSGVRVGHATIATPAVTTGVTVVAARSGARRVFAGRYSVDGGDGMTGLGVTEDFGAISAPVALVPAAVTGRIYDALIQHGLGDDPGLSEDAGWPPVVIGINDSEVNLPAATRAAVGEGHLGEALRNALGASQGNGEGLPDANPSGSSPARAASQEREGSVGIGAGLAAFGCRGGLGTSSRLQGEYVVGALVAANGGARSRLAVDGTPVVLPGAPESAPRNSGGFAAVLATDAPLAPRQLDHLAGRAAFGLVRVGLLEERTREGLVLALSTTGLVDAEPGPDGTVGMRSFPDTGLPSLFAAAAEACEEAVLNGLLQATSLPPEQDLALGPLRQQGLGRLPAAGWPDEVRRRQQDHGGS